MRWQVEPRTVAVVPMNQGFAVFAAKTLVRRYNVLRAQVFCGDGCGMLFQITSRRIVALEDDLR